MVMVSQTPERSTHQCMAALERANEIRLYRARVKREIAAGARDVAGELRSVDPLLAQMKVVDLLLAVPKYGRVKVNRVLARNGISPSKAVGGLSERQRRVLVLALSGSGGMVRDDD